jgi:hypothetical protein
MAVNINPSQSLNLGGQPRAYADTFSALNLFVGADAWIFQDANGNEVRGQVETDAKGWPTEFPVINGEAKTIWANVFYTKIMPPGDYIVEWEGSDLIVPYQNYEMIGPNKYLVHYEGNYTNGDDGITLRIDNKGADTTIDIRDVKIYKAEYADLVAMGESFDPKWFQAIDDFRILRMHDWQGTNFSEVTGPTENDFTSDQAFWVTDGRGMPYEQLVKVANEARSDLWINIPHMATDEYIRAVAAYVKANLAPDLRVYVEYSNEYWTTIFDQHDYLVQKGNALFPGEEFATGQAYAARFSEMTAIFKEVFGSDGARLFPTLTLDDDMFKTGEALAVLTSPDWVAKGGTSPLDAGLRYLATDGYFSWFNSDPNMDALVDSWMRQADGGFAAARDFLIDRIKTELVPNWQLGRQLADQYGLEFGVYEGGALLINGLDFSTADPKYTEFNKAFQLSTEMKQVYEVAMQEWQKIGNGTFAWYSDTGRAGPWGDYGLWNAPDFKPEPRTDVIIDANTNPSPWLANDPRGSSTFDNGLYDADTAGTNAMSGTNLADRLYGLTGNDNIQGFDGDDRLVGGADNDTLSGDGGNDALYGGSGGDTLQGGSGNDLLQGDDGADRMFGGDGDDTISYDASDVLADVRGGAGLDTLLFTSEAVQASFSLRDHEFERAEGRFADNASRSWATLENTYTSEWLLDTSEYINDNRSRSEVDYDQVKTNTWQAIYRNFDAQNRLASEDYVYDNGTRGNVDYDETNAPANIWKVIYRNYDSLGRLATEDYLLDNGRLTTVDYDETGLNSWRTFYRNYDAQGRVDFEDVVFDNGTRTQADYDQAGQFSWSKIYYDYDALGNLIRSTVIPD